MVKKRKWAVIAAASTLAVVTALAAVLGAPQAALAASSNAPVSHRGFPGGATVQTDSDLAEALGITVDELETAQETARVAAIDEALEQGLITQAQADALKENQRAGFGRRGMAGILGAFGLDADIDQEALLADALGITVEELQEAQLTARDARLEQAVEDGKLTQEQADLMKAKQALQQYMQDQDFFAKAVQQAVEAGIITQTQADAILSRQDSGVWGFGKGGMRDLGGFSDFGGRGRRR